MAWCFSTRASVATVLTTHPCVSRCLRINVEQPPCHHLNQSSTQKFICIPRPLWIDITLYTNWVFSMTNQPGKCKHISKFLFYTLQDNCGTNIVTHYDNGIKPRQVYSPQRFIDSYDATTKMKIITNIFMKKKRLLFLYFIGYLPLSQITFRDKIFFSLSKTFDPF